MDFTLYANIMVVKSACGLGISVGAKEIDAAAFERWSLRAKAKWD